MLLLIDGMCGEVEVTLGQFIDANKDAVSTADLTRISELELGLSLRIDTGTSGIVEIKRIM